MFAALMVIVALLDQATKAFVIATIPENTSIQVIPGLLAWTHVRNPGAAFGLLPFQRPLFIVVAVLMLGAAFIFRKRIMQEPILFQIGVGLGLGGAVGNLIDRLRTGFVTDFIQVPIIPIFNVADTAITFGVAILLWTSFFPPKEPYGDTKHSEDEDTSGQNAVDVPFPVGEEGSKSDV